MEHTKTVDVWSSTMPVQLIEPDSATSALPGLILCHHREGVDDFTIDAGRRLAVAGFVVAIPNMYHRRPAGESWELSRETISDVNSCHDLRRTADLLRGQKSVRNEALGIIGHCMGGRTAFLGAAVMPELKACVVLYGGGIFRSEGTGMPAPIAMTQNIRAAILGLYGDQDHVIPLQEIHKLIGTLKEHNIRNEFHIYENAGHAFQDFCRPKMYRQSVSDDAWHRSINFLRKELC